jgi:hypothetical protein
MPYSETFLKRIETSNTKKPNIPDYELKNPLDAQLFVNGIVLIADSYFQLKGKCVVLVNGAPVFNEQDSESFKDVNEIPIALTQKTLGRSQKIEVFVWNSVDSDKVALSINLKLGENQDDTFAGAKAVDKQSQKDDVSDFENIYPLQNRSIGNIPIVIDMKGYKSLIVLISAPTLPNGVVLPDGNYTDTCDGNFTTYASITAFTNPQPKITYPTQANRIVKGRVSRNNISNPNKNIFAQLQYSVNDVDWTNDSDPVHLSEVIVTIGSGIARNAKYWRIIVTQNGIGGVDPNAEIYEIYNSEDYGGTASISFEILGADGNWITYIPASEFGTSISIGSASIAPQVGDVTNLSITGKPYKIPSTQSRFRSNLSVTNGAVNTAIAIQRVT